MDSAHVARNASNGGTQPHGPSGYILSYGVSYKATRTEKELPTCPPSAEAVHEAFVSRCGFSRMFSPALDNNVTNIRVIEDVRRAAMTMASHDVVVLFFSGHGNRMDDTACVYDSVGCVVSVRKLQAVFAEVVVERYLRDVAFVVILDCCQTLSHGELLNFWCGHGVVTPHVPLLAVCVGGAGVADPSDDRDDLNLVVADAAECSWFVGFATSPSALRA